MAQEAHEVEPAPEYVPAAQFPQFEAPLATWNLPLGQLTQEPLPLPLYLPALQLVQAVAAAPEKVPAGQAPQVVWPVVAVYLPPGQLAQAPAEEYLPAAQLSVQTVEPATEVPPEGQLVQPPWPEDDV